MLISGLVQIRLTFEESGEPGKELPAGRRSPVELLEGHQEFLNALLGRLHEITRRQGDRLQIFGDDTHPLGPRVRPKS